MLHQRFSTTKAEHGTTMIPLYSNVRIAPHRPAPQRTTRRRTAHAHATPHRPPWPSKSHTTPHRTAPHRATPYIILRVLTLLHKNNRAQNCLSSTHCHLLLGASGHRPRLGVRSPIGSAHFAARAIGLRSPENDVGVLNRWNKRGVRKTESKGGGRTHLLLALVI